MDTAEKIDRIIELLSKSLTREDEKRAWAGIICGNEFNSTEHVYNVYTERLNKLQEENKEVKQLMSELNDDEILELYDNIWAMARAEVEYVMEEDESCEEEEEPWIWR